MRNFLLDEEFLRQLDLVRDKTTYAKIILLTWDEQPVEEIQGRITGGSVNIDGASAVRRTCSLSMVSQKINLLNTYWGLKNKFKLEIGVENTINPDYPDILWFKQGMYIFTSLNMNVQSNNFTISLNGKDKMCLLNGEVGGIINASTDFGKLEEYETMPNGEIVRKVIDIPIVDIIKNIVHVLAGEPLQNIVLNDIENYGLELLEYRGEKNIYMPRHIETGEVSNMIINPLQKYYLANGDYVYVDNEENKKAENIQLIYYDRTGINSDIATKVWTTEGRHDSSSDNAYNIIKVAFGETAGYRRTELTYPGELVGNVGENLVGILDKIKNMFGDFEYFYDVDGRFIFQKKKTYINTSFNNLQVSENESYVSDALHTSSTVYSFENGILLTAFASAPQLLNIKNDFSIWGKRKSSSGADLPIHMRYAIDFKPTYYKPIRFEYVKIELTQESYQPNKYYIKNDAINRYVLSTDWEFDLTQTYYAETNNQLIDSVEAFTDDKYDWREIIYQMALDYFKYNHKKDNFTQLIANANPDHYPTGITGYEIYYTDMQGFWRQLYHPGVIQNDTGKDYDLFTHQELYNAAREVILQERAFIENEDISQLLIDYVYDNFNAIRNNFIQQIDFSLQIEKRVKQGFDIESAVIQELLQHRWEKMNNEDSYDYEQLMTDYIEKYAYDYGVSNEVAKEQLLENSWYKTLNIMLEFKDRKITQETDYSIQIHELLKNPEVTINDYRVQKLLAMRWKKIIDTPENGGQDPYDYDELYNIYLQSHPDDSYEEKQAWRITYNILKEYTNNFIGQNVYSNIAEKIKQYMILENESNNTISYRTPIRTLLVARLDKMGGIDTTDYNIEKENYLKAEGTSINDAQYKLLNLLQEFQTECSQDISLIICNYVSSGLTEQSEIIQELLVRRWDKMKGDDPYNYLQLMTEYLEQDNTSKKDDWYKTLQILNNYKIEKSIEDKDYDETDYSLQIEQKIKEGYDVDSYEVQNLLAARWAKMKGKEVRTTNQYFSEMQEEYIQNNESAWYQTLLAMYNYKNAQEEKYVDKDKIFIKEVDDGKYEIIDSYLDFLLTSREKKINNFDSYINVVSNEKLIWIIVQIIKNLDWKKSDFKTQLLIMMDQQLNKDAYDFSAELINYIVSKYDKRKSFFYVDNQTNSIYIEDSHIQYLLDMRQEKINGMGSDYFYIDNNIFVITMIELFETIDNANDFKTKIEEKMSQAYAPLDKDMYDFSAEVIDYMYLNYSNRNNFFDLDETSNAVKVKDQYISYLLILRQEKINELYGADFFPQNDMFVTILREALDRIENNETEEKEEAFKNSVELLINKFSYQLSDPNYDFSLEVINYIAENYTSKNEFFLVENNTIKIKNLYIQHLMDMRQNKINNMYDSTVSISNSELVKLIMETINETEDSVSFKNNISNKLANWNK